MNGSQTVDPFELTTEVAFSKPEDSRRQVLLPVYDLIIHAVIEILIVILIIGGNTVVLISILVHRNLRTINNMFLMSLAIADLLMGVIVSPLRIYAVYLSPIISGELTQVHLTCALRLFFQNISFGVSLYSMCGIALDRYIAVVHPFKYSTLVTHRRVRVYIICIWLYIICLSAVPFLIKGSVSFGEGDSCILNQVVRPLFFTLAKAHVFIAILLTVVAHMIVSIVAIKTNAKIKGELVRFNNNMAVAHRNESKIAKAMTLVVGVFLLCWLPQTITSFIKWDDEPLWFKSLYFYMIALVVANSGMNPWIYATRLKAMRRAMKNVLRCSCLIK